MVGDEVEGVGMCREHPGQALDFWCREEGGAVCPHCLIFGAHRGHEALTRQQRFVPPATSRHLSPLLVTSTATAGLTLGLSRLEELRLESAVSRVGEVVEQLATSRARLGESGVKEREKLVRAVEEELERRAVLEREALVGGGRVVLSAPLYCTTPRKVGNTTGCLKKNA